jgi:hypothetical protein
MAQQIIDIGISANDGNGDTLRAAGSKINDNFAELYNNPIYSLPIATANILGGIKVGNTLHINSTSGTLNLNAAINDLTDVTISSPSNGQVLKYNGTQWINGTDEGQSGNPFDQELNTTDQVEFISTTADEYILGGSGTPTLESETDVFISAVGKVQIISKSPFRLANMTTAERDALTNVANGDVIYNTNTNKFQGRASGAWVDLH